MNEGRMRESTDPLRISTDPVKYPLHPAAKYETALHYKTPPSKVSCAHKPRARGTRFVAVSILGKRQAVTAACGETCGLSRVRVDVPERAGT